MLAKPIMCFGERIHHKVVKEFLKSRNESKQLHEISLFFGSPTHAKATVISYSDYLNSPSHLVLQDNVAHKQPTYVSSGLQLTTDEATINGIPTQAVTVRGTTSKGQVQTLTIGGSEVLEGQTADQECEMC